MKQAHAPAHIAISSAENLTGQVAIELFLDHCRGVRQLSPHSVRAYRTDLKSLLTCLGDGTPIREAAPHVLLTYARALLRDVRLKPATVKRRLATLKVFLRWLVRERLLPTNPLAESDIAVKLPKRLPRALHPQDLASLVRMAERETSSPGSQAQFIAISTYFILVCLFATGLRVGELVSVTLQNVSDDGAIQVRGKGNRERRVYLAGEQAVALLHRYLAVRLQVTAATDRLLVSPTGAPLSEQLVRKLLRELAERCRLSRRVTPHMLRHTAATQLLDAGVDIRILQRLLGHASIATTELYTHVSDAMLRSHLTTANTFSRVLNGIA